MATSEKIQLKGASQYKKDLQQIVAQSKALASEMNLVKSSFDKTTSAEQKNEAIGKQLSKQIETQKQYVEKLTQAYKAEVAASGEQSTSALKAKDSLNKAQTALNKMEAENRELTDAENKETAAAERNADAHSKLNGVLGAAGAALGMIATATAAGIKLGKEVISSFSEYEQLTGGVETLFGTTREEFVQMMTASGASISTALQEFKNFEQGSSIVMKNADNAFKTAGMSANEYMETVTSFSASLIQSLGGDTQKAAQYADKAITDMSDNANKMGSDISTLQSAYAGFAKQNYTLLDNLKLGYGGTKEEMERLIRDAEALSDTFEVTHTKTKKGADEISYSYADIIEAIHIIQDDMGITGTTAKEAEQTIAGSIDSLKAAFDNLTTGFGRADADMSKLSEDVVNAFTTVSKNITPVIQNIIEALPSVADSLIGALGDLLPTLLKTVTNLFSKVLTTIVKLLPSLVPAAAQAIMTIVSALIDNLPLIMDTALQIILALVNGFAENLPTLIPAIVQMIMTIVTTLTSPENIDMLMQAAIALLMGLANGLIEAVPVLVQNIPQIIDNIVKALITEAVRLYQVASVMITQLANGLQEAFGTIVSKVGGWLKVNVIDPIKTKGIEGLKEAGKNLVQGLWKGIDNAMTWIKNQISKWVGNLLSYFKGLLGIHSPSTVFEGYGENIAQGLANGITGGMGAVRAALGAMPGVNGTYSLDASPAGLGGVTLYIDGIKYNTDDYVDTSITNFVENMVRRSQMYGR